MGTRGREIIGMDVEKLLHLLNRAFASEWLAYYQYWLGGGARRPRDSRVETGPEIAGAPRRQGLSRGGCPVCVAKVAAWKVRCRLSRRRQSHEVAVFLTQGSLECRTCNRRISQCR